MNDSGSNNGGRPEKAGTIARRYARIYGELWKNSVSREMSFKANFLLWILVEGLWFILQLSFIGVIYLHTDSIAGWNKWEVVMLLGASQFIQQIFQAFFLTNCTQLSELIRTGKLDFMLLLPVNTRFLVSLRQVDLGGFINATFGLAVMGWSAAKMHYTPSAGAVTGFLMLSMGGVLIHYSLMLALSSASFFTVRAQGIVWGYYNLLNIARLPDTAVQGYFKIFFKFVIPMLLVANVPVRWLTHRLASPADMAVLLLMTAAAFCFSEFVWRKSLRRYTSASS